MTGAPGARRCDERGVIMVMLSLMLPLLFLIGGIVIAVGSWFTHARHLQTKVDASALAGGGEWGFPCGPDVDLNIRDTARAYAGAHTATDGTIVSSTYNPQVSGVGASKVFVTMNQAGYWDDTFPAADFTSPAGSVCEAMTLDVKATEDDTPWLFGWLPIWPDIKKKARVQIEEVEGLNGLLPISVRFPKPLSSAAVFYDELNGDILGVRYFNELATALNNLPTELRYYTTLNTSQGPASWAPITIPASARVGVAIATSFRPACDTSAPPGIPIGPSPCFEDSPAGISTVDDLCRQSGGRLVQCFYASGTGASQSVQSGLLFIGGYDSSPVANSGAGAPKLREVWLDSPTPTSCFSPYFNATRNNCGARLNATVDLGSFAPPPPPSGGPETRTVGNTQVRYRQVDESGTVICNFGQACTMDGSGSGNSTTWTSLNPTFASESRGNSFQIRVRVFNTRVNGTDCGSQPNSVPAACEVMVPPAGSTIPPLTVQRSFMGDTGDHSPVSGPIKFLRLTVGDFTGGNCSGFPVTGPAESQPTGATRCYYVEMGLRGGIARDQDEPPVVFNLTGTSQSAVLDCDPGIPFGQLDDEIALGCSPYYAQNRFDNPGNECPWGDATPGQFFVPPTKAAPFDDWPPYRCVLTRPTAAPNQMLQGFEQRFFKDKTNPQCPAEVPGTMTAGRNYWHDANNPSGPAFTFADRDNSGSIIHGNNIQKNDPRLITLFMTSYDSFGGSGNQMYPIVAFGSFYVTGYDGPGQVTDPCTDGDSDPSLGAGSKPPPDLNASGNNAYIWGHFVDNVVPTPNATSSGQVCRPQLSTMPCIPVLVE